ncbi:hypothetical protein N7447_002992 [Penicillium robsamsonii]|uniref:uncharacterized protein n=1 Tax=Penicillium robsamsonii TaxID=1792511 RepID=UPI002546E3F2|nr:uncharacterized protein N7447_002992 [Penicillium robsamsonii]KAJ5836966.1 hypothetical protein N7447_002992 [Penicillium robsamsonii]
MDNHPPCSAVPGSSGLPTQEDTTGFTNEPTGVNESASDNQPASTNESAGINSLVESGPSQWSSPPTLEILQAHMAADADSDEAAEMRVHPDFHVHLERLQRINETNRVNARREAEAQYQAYRASLVLNESQNQASRVLHDSQDEASMVLNESQHEASQILNDPQRGSSQFANQSNQPSYHGSAGHGSQLSIMDMSELYETQPSTSAGLIPHARLDTTDPTGSAHPRDHSSHHQPPSPYPTVTRRQTSASPSPLSNPPLVAPLMIAPRRYTEYGNPYTLTREPDLMPEGTVPCGPDRMLQAWLLRQQLIAGVRPENLQPMSNPRSMRHRTPPWIMINDSGAHIIRMEPARFQGVMLPMPDLPWFPRRANPNSSTAPASLNAPAISSVPAASNIQTVPSSANTQNSPVDHNLSVTPTSPVANSPVDTNLSTATESLFAPPVRAPPVRPATPRQFDISDPPNSLVRPGTSAPPNTPVAANPQNPDPDPRVVAFFQPLRLHEPVNSASSSAGALQSQIRTALTVQNRTDADSISSREAPGAGDPESSAASSEAANGNGNGVVHHGVTWSEPEDPEEEDSGEAVSPHLRRFLLDGADD